MDVESFCEACESLSDQLVFADKLMAIESTGAGVPRLTVAKEYNLHCTAAQKLKPFTIYNARHLALTAGASQVVGLDMQKSSAIENAPKLNMDCFNILKVRW